MTTTTITKPKFKRVTKARYWDMLEVLWPAYWDGVGFLVGEPWKHKTCAVTGETDTPAYAPFTMKGGQYYEGDDAMTIAEFKAMTGAPPGNAG